MKTDMDAVIKNVAVRNGAAFVKNDAVMQLITVIDTIMDTYTTQFTEQQKALLVSFSEKIEEGLLRVTNDTNTSTKNSVNAVTEYAKGILPQVMTAGAAEAAKAAKGELSGMVVECSIMYTSFKHFLKVCTVVIAVSAGAVLSGVLIGMMLLLR